MKADSPIDFLERLVSIPSYSGEEHNAAFYTVEQMRALGYRSAYIDTAGSPVGIWGADQVTNGRYLLLLGHIDTVRGFIEVRREKIDASHGQPTSAYEMILYGRGSVDAKGPLATFVQAVATLPQDLHIPIVVVGAVEEEVASSKGARQVVKDLPAPLAVIIGEPSNTLGITLGYKGRLVVNFSAERDMTHSAHQHESAAEIAFLAHSLILELQRTLNDGKSGAFAPLDYTIQSLHTKSDGLKEYVEMSLGFRLGPGFEPSILATKIYQCLSDAMLTHRFSLSTTGAEEPAQFEKNNVLAKALRVAIRANGLEPKHVLKTGTSDMNVLSASWPCPMVAYGPGDSALDHTPEEHINLGDYERAIAILSIALRDVIINLETSG